MKQARQLTFSGVLPGLSLGALLSLAVACAPTKFAGGAASTQNPATTGAGAGTAGGPAAANIAAGGPTIGTPNGAGTTPTSAATSTPTSVTGTPTVGTTCGASGITQATLLTPSVQNSTPGNYLEYQLTLTNCAGGQQTFSAAAILFDLNAQLPQSSTVPMTYTVHDSAGNTMNGTLAMIKGTDLFNDTGANFFHYQTDQSVAFATADTSIILHINLGGQTLDPFQNAVVTSPNQLQTFLRFGNAVPVSVVCQLIGTNNQFGVLPN